MVDWVNSITEIAGKTQSFLKSAISASNTLVSVAGTVGIAGFVFDIADGETVELDSDITDHYVENGTAVQDHIALRPERVTVRGFVGEYRYIVESNQTKLQKATKKLTTLTSYLPPLSDAATAIYKGLQGKNENSSLSLSGALNNVTNTAMDLFKAYRNINLPQTEQQKAFIYFEALRNSRALFTIQTPFRYYTDMAIESIRATQSGFSRDQSDFEIAFKKMRFVSVDRNEVQNTEQSETITENVYAARLSEQKATITDDGLISVKGIKNDTFDSILDRYKPKSISDMIRD
jgi:hypothetical protein